MLITVTFLVTISSLFLLRPLAVKLGFVDYPTYRKNHTGQVPLIGGICIFIGLLASQIYLNEFDKTITIVLIASSLMLILGVCDDVINLTAKKKLVIQSILVTLTIYFTDIKIKSLGHLFGLTNEIELGFFSLPFTVIAIIGLTNAFNMIDGIDGLAGGLAIIACIGILISNLFLENSIFTNILLGIISSLVPFLIFNITSYKKLKIFLGDGGSLFLGFIISLALVYNFGSVHNFTPAFALWCVTIPLFDFLSIVILRKLRKHSIILADRDHIHHFLERLGFVKKSIMLIIISAALVMLLIGYIIEIYFPTLSFPTFIAIFFLYYYMRFYLREEKN